jgi:y4mF family transcriptional regulator
MNVGTIIKERRTQLKLSQQDLAEFAEVGIATIKDIERGKGNPSLQTLEKIFNVLGLEMSFGIKKTESMNENMNKK